MFLHPACHIRATAAEGGETAELPEPDDVGLVEGWGTDDRGVCDLPLAETADHQVRTPGDLNDLTALHSDPLSWVFSEQVGERNGGRPSTARVRHVATVLTSPEQTSSWRGH